MNLLNTFFLGQISQNLPFVIPGIAVQANLRLRDVSLEMVEDFKHDRYKDDARVRNAEVNSSMGVSGTAGSLGMA